MYVVGVYVPPNNQLTVHRVEHALSRGPTGVDTLLVGKPQCLPGVTLVPIQRLFVDRHRKLPDSGPYTKIHSKEEVQRKMRLVMEDV